MVRVKSTKLPWVLVQWLSLRRTLHPPRWSRSSNASPSFWRAHASSAFAVSTLTLCQRLSLSKRMSPLHQRRWRFLRCQPSPRTGVNSFWPHLRERLNQSIKIKNQRMPSQLKKMKIIHLMRRSRRTTLKLTRSSTSPSRWPAFIGTLPRLSPLRLSSTTRTRSTWCSSWIVPHLWDHGSTPQRMKSIP
jgi:hypothetical protein